MKKLLTLIVAGLDHHLIQKHPLPSCGFDFRPMDTVFPALTCPVQASLRTGRPPDGHGLRLNGVYDHALARAMFWEQSARLIPGPRIWDEFRSAGGRVGMMFWQQSLGDSVDWVVSPKPIHKHGGGMIQHCYSHPADLYPRLLEKVGRPFKLQHYWGPLASSKASDWITDMLCAALPMDDCPECVFSYLPHLDYVLQREGPSGSHVAKEMEKAGGMIARILNAAGAAGYDVVVLGDYSISDATTVVYPNRILRDAGLFNTIQVGNQHYPDFFHAGAFAITDHEAAEVVIHDVAMTDTVRSLLEQDPGIESIAQRTDPDGSHRLLLTAADGAWFAYPWWSDPKEAPDFASHVDIHNKPGFDPCELFFGWPPGSVSQNPARIKGSHGRVGKGREIAWACTDPSFPIAADICELAKGIKTYLAG